ncbi:MAG: CRTAC1 family protein [Bacteroidales bacterium]|nr:CRTAC1 family protein [Bacteroidales bacterium]
MKNPGFLPEISDEFTKKTSGKVIFIFKPPVSDRSSGKKFFVLLLLLSLLILPGCNSGNKNSPSSKNRNISVPAPNEDYFQEIGEAIGLRFIHSIGDKNLNNIVESSAGGVAFLDYNQDGYIDIYFTSGTWIEEFSEGQKPDKMPGNCLYRNMKDGTFEDVTEKAGVGGPWYTMGVTAGDFNNDGFPDLFVSNYGPNVLLKNNGNGTFTDVTKKAGVSGGKEFSVGAVWLDYDLDGLLDLYVGNYLTFDPEYKYFYAPDGFPGPMAYDAQKDVLYHNNGDGTFEDVTDKMGIKDIDGRAMGVGAADYDEDGYVDIYVANDHTLNYLFHNDAGKGFTDRGTMTGTAFSQAGEATVSMSVDFADYNNDGLLDMFVSDDTYCSLYRNEGNGIYTDKAYASGLSTVCAQFVGWSSTFFDYDNDGDVDIFKTNGELKHLYGHEDQLLENIGGEKFKEVSLERGEYFKKEYVGRGTCVGDYDNDGDLDVVITNLNDQCRFLRNNKGNANNWIMLSLEGTISNRDAIGARIRIKADGKEQIAQKKSTTGYLSQNDPRIHFGLGRSEKIEMIEIKWPSGKVQILENIPVNQILKIKEQ